MNKRKKKEKKNNKPESEPYSVQHACQPRPSSN